MRRVIASTKRLQFKEMSAEDGPGAFEMNSDPLVIQYTGDEPFVDVEAATAFMQAYDHYKFQGFGRWSLFLKESGDYVGFCGLKRSQDSAEVDLGYRLIQKYWGQGLATEAAIKTLEIGFMKHQLPEIVGRSRQENTASVKVLEKLGMHCSHLYKEDGHDWLLYKISRANYLKLPEKSY